MRVALYASLLSLLVLCIQLLCKPCPRKIYAVTRAIRVFDALRLVSCLALLALHLADPDPSPALLFAYAYASLLALFKPFRPSLQSHATFVLFSALLVYLHRDVWPLLTYTEHPKDPFAWPLYATLSFLTTGALFVPLFVPRAYSPVDPNDPMQTPNPEQTASLFGLAVYSFLDHVIMDAYRVPHLPHDKLPPLADYDRSNILVSNAAKHLDTFKGAPPNRHIFLSLIRIFFWEYLGMALCLVAQSLASLASPIAVNRILAYLESDSDAPSGPVKPHVYILLLFLGPVLGSLAFQWYVFLGTTALARVQAVLTELIFEHGLRVRMFGGGADKDESGVETSTTGTSTLVVGSPPRKSKNNKTKQTLQGTLSTLITVDVDRITDGKDFLMIFLQMPFELAISVAFLWVVIGWSALVGLGAMALLLPLPGYLAGKVQEVNKRKMERTEERVEEVTQTINVLRMVKLFGWEGKMSERLKEKRGEELVWLYKDKMLYLLNDMINFIIPTLTMLVTYATYTLIAKQPLTPSKIFSSLAVFDIVRNLMMRLAWFFSEVIQAKVSLDRVGKFLKETELLDSFTSVSSPSTSTDAHDDDDGADYNHTLSLAPADDERRSFVGFNNAMFAWGQRSDGGAGGATTSASESEIESGVDDDEEEEEGKHNQNNKKKRLFRLKVPGSVGFKEGKLNLIVGPTGAGKTSILMALLGEMHFMPYRRQRRSLASSSATSSRAQTPFLQSSSSSSDAIVEPDEEEEVDRRRTTWFNLPRGGGVAYAAQESWVQNETIRDNVVFGAEFDEVRYKEVMRQCALEQDLKLFEAGDMTEVGEKGLTLSGGQKARVTLARAVYSSARIVLLDDVLAALDVHTSKHIVRECLQGDLLRGRTVLLVTHNVAMTSPIAEHIVAVGMDGVVREVSDISEVHDLKEHAGDADEEEEEEEEEKKAGEDLEALASVLVPATPEGSSSASSVDGATTVEEDPRNQNQEQQQPQQQAQPQAQPDGKLILAEEIEEGHVSWKAIKLYLVGLGGKSPILFVTTWIAGLFLTEVCMVFSVWFLGYWGTQYEKYKENPWEVPTVSFLGDYSAILVSSNVIYAAVNVLYIFGTLRASRTINAQLMDSVLGASFRWLDETPTSRIITRCTQDVGSVDGWLSFMLSSVVTIAVTMIVKLGGPVFFSPIFLIPGVFIALLGMYLGNIYLKAQMSVKREMSNARAPVLAHFGAAITGLVSIRAYGAQKSFKRESLKRIDHFTKMSRMSFNLNRWIGIRIDFLGASFTAALASYLLVKKKINAANTGFSLNMSLEFCSLILWLVRCYNEFEVKANSLERIQAYLEIDHEPKPTEAGKPPAAWPTSGDLQVEGLSARYSATGPKVLHDLKFHVKSGERVGIVGRTGSGKSSLTLSLLRCIFTEGNVYYDGLLTSNLNLDALRSSVTIIPQVPELISGTLRRNLDPFEQNDDAALNGALRAAGLFSLQDETDEARLTLDSDISGGGGNLSVGQRQIIALARAMVRNSKLLILDEATSAIDHKTDSIIQATLRNELGADTTVITIAHRLQTIMDADKIMVLDKGRIVEYDSPQVLLQKKGGYFRTLVDGSGDRKALYAKANKSSSTLG